jgi:hypothetical protein
MPEISREEYNSYRETILQYHLYEQIFKESPTQLKMPSEDLLEDELECFELCADALIKEFTDLQTLSAFFDLRWYAIHKVKSMFSKTLPPECIEAETVNANQYKNDPFSYDLNMITSINKLKSYFNPSLLRLLFALLETFRYYCKVAKKCIKQCNSQEEFLNEYCKRVTALSNRIVEWLLCVNDRIRQTPQ